MKNDEFCTDTGPWETEEKHFMVKGTKMETEVTLWYERGRNEEKCKWVFTEAPEREGKSQANN